MFHLLHFLNYRCICCKYSPGILYQRFSSILRFEVIVQCLLESNNSSRDRININSLDFEGARVWRNHPVTLVKRVLWTPIGAHRTWSTNRLHMYKFPAVLERPINISLVLYRLINVTFHSTIFYRKIFLRWFKIYNFRPRDELKYKGSFEKFSSKQEFNFIKRFNPLTGSTFERTTTILNSIEKF